MITIVFIIAIFIIIGILFMDRIKKEKYVTLGELGNDEEDNTVISVQVEKEGGDEDEKEDENEHTGKWDKTNGKSLYIRSGRKFN
jgi:hypothetical protein